jgi:hypothetical protein
LKQTDVTQLLHKEAGQAFLAQSMVEQLSANAADAIKDANNTEMNIFFIRSLL